MLAWPATAGQATFEPDEPDEDEELEEEEEEEEEDDEPLPTVSEAFLPLLPGLSPGESALDAPSDFLASEPLDEVLAASESFCGARLSVR
jgi:hypothetical protein